MAATQPSSIDSVVSSIYGDAQKSADKFQQDTEKGIAKIEGEKMPEPPKLTPAPKSEDYQRSPIEGFGSAASFLAMFGSLLTKHPLTTALNSSAAVMNAYHQQDAESFKSAMDRWKVDTDNAWKMADYNQKLYKDVIGKDEAELRARAVSVKDDLMLHMADAKMSEQLYRDRERQMKAFSVSQIKQEEYNRRVDELVAKNTPLPQAQRIVYDELFNHSSATQDQLNQVGSIDWKNADPKQIVPGTGETVAAIAQKAEAVAKSNNYAGLGIGWNPIKAAVGNYIAQVHPDVDLYKAGLKNTSKQAQARTLGGQEIKIKLSSNILDNSLPSLMSIADKYQLSPSTDINKMYNFVMQHGSSEDKTNFSTQLRAVTTDYSQFIGRGRPTVHSDQEALKILHDDLGVTSLKGFSEAVNIERENVGEGMEATEKDLFDEAPRKGKKASAAPPAEAIEMLKNKPDTREQFDEIFGKGAAASALGE